MTVAVVLAAIVVVVVVVATPGGPGEVRVTFSFRQDGA